MSDTPCLHPHLLVYWSFNGQIVTHEASAHVEVDRFKQIEAVASEVLHADVEDMHMVLWIVPPTRGYGAGQCEDVTNDVLKVVGTMSFEQNVVPPHDVQGMLVRDGIAYYEGEPYDALGEDIAVEAAADARAERRAA